MATGEQGDGQRTQRFMARLMAGLESPAAAGEAVRPAAAPATAPARLMVEAGRPGQDVHLAGEGEDGPLASVSFAAGAVCRDLILTRVDLATLPADLHVTRRLELVQCPHLTGLPPGLRPRQLIVSHAPRLEALPPGLALEALTLTACPALTALPEDLALEGGVLSLADSPGITELPERLAGPIEGLDASGCYGLSRLPEGLAIMGWIEIGGSGLEAALARLVLERPGVAIRRRGREIVAASGPRRLLAADPVARNALVRALGLDRFLAEGDAQEIDRGTGGDAGYRLVRLDLGKGPEHALVIRPAGGAALLVAVPRYIISCYHARAWLAKFASPSVWPVIARE